MVSFLDRLKQRKLFQWALAYSAGAWALLEGVNLVGGQFGWPTRLLQSITVLVAVGFFVVLVLAWYHGEKGQQRVSGKELVALTAVLALGGGFLAALNGSGRESSSAIDPGNAEALEAIPPPREGIHRVSLILADFENHTSDPHIGLMTTEALRVVLAGSRHLALMERGSLTEALRRMEMDASTSLTRDVAVAIAQREGVPFVVAGQVDAVGGGIQFLAQLIRPGEDTAAGGRRVVVSDSTEILSAIGELAKGLREDTGESAKSVSESVPLPQVTTGSLEALRFYARATRTEDDFRRAAELLERAIAADTTFAMAYRELGAVLFNAGTDRTRSIQSYKKAYQLRDRLTEPERLSTETGYYSDVSGDVRAMLDAARTTTELYPNRPLAYHHLGYALAALGMYEQAAAAYRRGLDIGPSFALFYNFVGALITLGRFAEAEEVLADYAERFPGSWGVYRRRAELEWARGDYQAAVTQLDSLGAIARTNWDARRRLLTGQRALSRRRGQAAAALFHAQALYDYWASEGVEGRALGAAAVQANIHSRLLGDAASARAVLDRVMAEHPPGTIAPHDVPYFPLIEAYAWAGRPDVSRILSAEYALRVPSDERGDPYGRPGMEERVTSQIALAEGNADEAVQLLHEARNLSCHPALCAVLLAIAHDSASRPDSAMTWYERFLEAPRPVAVDDPYLATALERLAQLHDEHGDPTRAEELYGRFIELWEDADPELQPRVQAARARLGR